MRSRLTVPTHNNDACCRPHRLWRVLVVLGAIAWAPCPLARAAVQSGPPPLPGPPPGAGSGFLAPPATGITSPAGAVGAPARLPVRVSGPALLSGIVPVHKLQLVLAIACETSGRARLTASAVRPGVLAETTYVCRNRRASAQLSLRRADARRLAALGPTLASVTLGHGTATARVSLTLQPAAERPSYWSDGGLECSVLGSYEPYLAAPNFTVTPPAVIDVRPWVAWYTATNGWRWLGIRGVNASAWYRWTATPSGVQEWKTPPGAINLWTWGPIYVVPGQGTYAIGVFEIVYWFARPTYVWRYAVSSPAANKLTTYCNYP